MNLTITNAEHADMEMLTACIKKLQNWGDAQHDGAIHVYRMKPLNGRDRPGWTEYAVHVLDEAKQVVFVMACIRRTPGADIEFCS